MISVHCKIKFCVITIASIMEFFRSISRCGVADKVGIGVEVGGQLGIGSLTPL